MDYVIAKTERKISNTTLSRDLRKLMKMGFIEKENDEYRIPDPITRYTLLKDFP
ncbi:transposase [Saccharolobus solfataricus]|nr:transposase [Saccharolobus solfataricus]AKA77825.1 transposase [Saccharolobus solfataricus]AKA80520.1 transposase [Saccharolobus solfataricus]AZF69571.1 transposase [Saccharolobus solfataricus]AZF72191.1 transposase [Saccharolobus solfataricus]